LSLPHNDPSAARRHQDDNKTLTEGKAKIKAEISAKEGAKVKTLSDIAKGPRRDHFWPKLQSWIIGGLI
jgi:hypothetical protein